MSDPVGWPSSSTVFITGYGIEGGLRDGWRGQIATVAGDSSDNVLEALIKMEVACRLALESLPALPTRTEQALRDPVEQLCRVTQRELQQLQPRFTRA